jgi:DnaK suppressor protein
MTEHLLDTLAQQLRRQRALLVGEVVDTKADLLFIGQDREADFEERAQEERAARTLARLGVQEQREIEEIDAALQRLAAGSYGICEDCQDKITDARLRALPATRLCIDCARVQEQRPVPFPVSTVPEEAPSSGKLPPELTSLSELELEEYLREQVREDGRVDMEELRLVCRHGVVHLEGALPSEAEHSILLALLTDVIGLQEIVDHLQITEVLWEREERSKAVAAEELLPGREPYGTEDIVESIEEGVEYVPPIQPVPKEE